MSDDDFDSNGKDGYENGLCPHCGMDCADMDVLAGGERRYTSCQTRKPQNNKIAKPTVVNKEVTEAGAKFATIGDLLKFKKIAI